MKAKVIKTGEVVGVHKTTTGWASDNLNTTRFFNESELDFDYREWEIFRREAAKDILCAMLGRVERFYTGVSIDGKNKISNHKDFIKLAIEDADKLIKQLKKEQK